MAYDIGPKIGIEGEAEFRKAIRDINTTMRTLGTEMQAVTSQFDKNDNSTEALTAKNKVLNKQIDEQRKKLEMLQKGLTASAQKYGENDTKTQKWQQAVNKATADLNKMERELKENKQAMEQAANATDKYGKEVEEAGKKSSLLGDIFKGGFFANLATQGLTTVISAIKSFASAAMDAAGNAIKLSQETGLTTDEVQEMQYVTTALDGSVELLAKSQARLTRSMAEARDGTAQYKEAYDKLGLSVTDTSGNLKTASDFMYEVLDALGQVANETERDAIALEIFGRSAQELNPLIKAGGDEIKRLREEARQTGAVMSKEAVEAIDSLGDSIDLVKQRLTAFIGEGLARLMGVGRETVASLTESARALDKVNEEYEKTATHTAAVATVALDYVDRLEELEKQGLSTAEAQEEYRAIVAKINSLLPDLNLKIDEQTGLIQTSTQAIRDNISAWKEQAMAQALQERYRDIIKAQADAMAELTENEIKHAEAQAEVAANSAQLDVVYRQVAELFGRTGDEAEKLGAALDNWTLGEITHLALELGVSLGNLVDEISKYRNELIDAEKKEKLYSAAIEESKKILEEHKEEVRIAEEATKDLLGITDEATDATKDNARAVELNTETLENYIATTRKLNNDITKLNSALKEQAENGQLSVSTTLDLIEAGYAATLQIDKETGAVRLNQAAYEDLARAKIAEQAATASLAARKAAKTALEETAAAAKKAALGLYDEAKAHAAAAAAAQGQAVDANATIRALDAMMANVGQYEAKVSSVSSAAKEATKEISNAFAEAVKTIDRALELGEIDQAEYWRRYSELMSEHLKQGTKEWEDANHKLLLGQKKLNEALEAESRKTYETMSDNLHDIKDEYDKALSDIQGQVDGMADRIAKIELVSKGEEGYQFVDVESLRESNEHIKRLNYNLDQLERWGISDSLLAEIAKMETETANSYAEYLLSLTKSGEWKEYMQEWERRQELALETATNFYKDEIELLDKEFGSKLTDMLNNMTSEAGKIGQEIAAALAAGILSGQTAVDQAMQSLMPGATFTGGAAAGGTAASQSATINLTVELDGRQVAKGTYPYILEEGKIQGESQIGG